MMFKKILTRAKIDINILPLLAMLVILGFTFPVIASAQPAILYTDILSGPNKGGENNNGIYLSIFGKGFGQSSDLSTSTKVYINGTEVTAYKYLGSSAVYASHGIQQLTIQPGPSVTSGPIKVVVDSNSSNTDHTFTVVAGDIYFVDNVIGNQSTGELGNINKPFRYVQQTWDRSDFGPSDFIIMRGTGTVWTDGSSSLFFETDKSGLNGKPMTIMGYPGENVEIQIKDSKYVFKFKGGSNYINVGNVNIVAKPGNQPGTASHFYWYGGTSNYRIVNVDMTKSIQGYRMMGVNGDYIKILGNYVHDNGDPGNKLSHDVYIDGGNGHLEFGWNHFENHKGGNCIMSKQTGVQDIKIHDNIIHGCDKSGVALGLSGLQDINIYNNIVYDTNRLSWGGASCIKIYDGSTGVIYNNIVYDCGNDNTNGGLYITGNVIDLVIKNNIIYMTGNSVYIENRNGVSGSNNIYFGSSQSTPGWDTNPIQLTQSEADKLFVNLGTDFHLQPNSPAIDAGINVNLDYDIDGNLCPMDGNENGTAEFDIGAYEYTGAYIPPAPDMIAPSAPTNLLIAIN